MLFIFSERKYKNEQKYAPLFPRGYPQIFFSDGKTPKHVLTTAWFL